MLILSGQWRREGVCRPGQTSLLPPPPPQSDLELIFLWLYNDGISVDCDSTLSWECKISEFHIFAPPNAAPCTVPPGIDALTPSPPVPVATVSGIWRISMNML